MSKLKELTWDYHKDAERQTFVKAMFKGKLTDEQYALYLWHQHAIYDVLEAFAMMHGLFNDIPKIRRAPSLLEDAIELWPSGKEVKYLPAITAYHDHLKTIMQDPDKIMAHVYVRHMGDLSGGQMIAKRVPGSGKYYQFDCEPNEYKELIRAKCSDHMADEAIECFKFATQLFKELAVECDLG
jgi:heme oxygenase